MAKDCAMQITTPQTAAHLAPDVTPWSLRAWPTLLWQADGGRAVKFQHLGTRVSCPLGGAEPPAGQTVWAAHAADGEAGVAWDWIQIARGVVAMADPMSLVTNLRLVGAEGAVLTAQQSALVLNELVRDLPWQSEVQRALHAGHS
jgi:hypothetical protein